MRGTSRISWSWPAPMPQPRMASRRPSNARSGLPRPVPTFLFVEAVTKPEAVRALPQRLAKPQLMNMVIGGRTPSSGANSLLCCAKAVVRADRIREELTAAARCKTSSASMCDRPRRPTGSCPGTGRAISIKGARNQSAVGTLVCRKTLFVMLVKVDGGMAVEALRGFEQAFSPLPPQARKTLTYDQGKEMALHKKLAESTGLKIYFAEPHSPWQRGICENTNGLIRQYLPKGTDLSVYSQRELDHFA